MIKSFEPIVTERLVIRKLKADDAHNFFKYRSLPEVYEFQSFRPKDIEEVGEFFGKVSEFINVPNSWFQLAICMKENNRLIGDIGIHFLADDAQIEIGYTLAPDFQGHGYATEALKEVIHYLFADLNKNRIIASVDPNHKKSIRLLEKMGMRKEAHFIQSIIIEDVWRDDCIYAILQEEWSQLSRG